MRDAALGPVNLYIRIMYIMLNLMYRLSDPCSFALRSRFHAWFEAFSRVPHLDGAAQVKSRTDLAAPAQDLCYLLRTEPIATMRYRRHGPDMSKCPSAR